MKKMILLIALMPTLVALTSNSIEGAVAPPANGCWSLGCKGTLGWVYTPADDKVYVLPPEGDTTLVQCTLVNNTYFTLKKTHPMFNEIYTMLMTGIATKQNVYLRVTLDSPDCEIQYAVIYP